MTRRKRIIIIISIIFTILILVAVALYLNIKNFTIKKILMADGQEYILWVYFIQNILSGMQIILLKK